MISVLIGITTSVVTVRDPGGTFAVEIKHNLSDQGSGRSKRALDLVSTVAGTLFVRPLPLVIAITIKLTSRGPIFYKQMRMGAEDGHF